MYHVESMNSFTVAIKVVARVIEKNYGIKVSQKQILGPSPLVRATAEIAESIRQVGYRLLDDRRVDPEVALMVFVIGGYLRSAGPMTQWWARSDADWDPFSHEGLPPSFEAYAAHMILDLSRGGNCHVPVELADQVRRVMGVSATMPCQVKDGFWQGVEMQRRAA